MSEATKDGLATRLAAWLRLPLFLLGLVLVFAADRYLGAENYHSLLRVVALTAIGLSLVLTAWCQRRALGRGFDGEASCFTYALFWQAAVVVALLGYFAYKAKMGSAAEPETAVQKTLLGLWLVVGTLGVFAGFGTEWSLRENGRGQLAEPQRVARAASASLLMGMLLAILVAVNYTAAKKDKAFDLSYLRTTAPSQATRKMLGTLTEPLTIGLFFPANNEVKEPVSEYFDALARLDPKVKVAYYDNDLQPTKAEEFKVVTNGEIVLTMGPSRRESIDIGTRLAGARMTLKNLDARFEKAFLSLTSQKRIAYFTRGHGEASWYGETSVNDPKRSLRIMEQLLRDQNYSLRSFGVGDGSANAVPDDAAAVVVVGPQKPFLPEETAALKAYLDHGGKLMVFLSLEQDRSLPGLSTEDPLLTLLEGLGIKYHREPLANDKNYVSATHSPVDQWFLFTNSFTSHDSIASLARHDERIAMLMFETGYLGVTPSLGKWKAFETVRSLPGTFVDSNRNFKFDPGEHRDAYTLGAVAEAKAETPAKPGQKDAGMSRVVVFANDAAASDALIRNPGNLLYVADGLKWLTGESKLEGTLTTEDDVKIQHTRKEDVLWFHATVLGMPFLVLLGGFAATRRRKRRGRNAHEGEGKHAV